MGGRSGGRRIAGRRPREALRRGTWRTALRCLRLPVLPGSGQRHPLAGAARAARDSGPVFGDHAVPGDRSSPRGMPPPVDSQPLGRDHGDAQSRMGRLADLAIVIPEADEDVIPQTRSFGSMYLAAQYLVALLADDAELADALRRLPELLPALLERWEPVVQGAAEADWNQAFFLGGGPLYGVTVEATLKLVEMSLSSAVSYHTLEVRHGPRSIRNESTLVVGLGSLRGAPYERQVLAELAEETPHVLAFTPGDGWDLSGIAKEIALGDRVPEHALGLLYLPLLQLLAYHRALHNGVNPDESRNLTSYIELSEGG